MIGRTTGIALSWLLLAGAYLALVGSLSGAEGAAAILCGGLAALWVRRIATCGGRRLRLRPSAFAPLRPALARLPGQTLRVGARLWRAALKGDVSGQERTLPPAAVADCPAVTREPHAAGACAVSVLTASLSPDTYVLRLEPRRGCIRVHAFLPEGAGGASRR